MQRRQGGVSLEVPASRGATATKSTATVASAAVATATTKAATATVAAAGTRACAARDLYSPALEACPMKSLQTSALFPGDWT